MKLVHSEGGATEAGGTLPHPQVHFAKRGDAFVAEFVVQNSALWSTDPSLPKDKSVTGLWDFDVVEVFITANPARTPYLEFQLSPLGQFFELKVIEPRKVVQPRVGFEWKRGVRVETGRGGSIWRARFEIPVMEIVKATGGDGKTLWGGMFSILGKKGERSYWASFLPPQQTPDFHLPKLFQPV